LTGLIENLVLIVMVLSALIVVVILWMANKTSFRELELDIKRLKFKLKK